MFVLNEEHALVIADEFSVIDDEYALCWLQFVKWLFLLLWWNWLEEWRAIHFSSLSSQINHEEMDPWMFSSFSKFFSSKFSFSSSVQMLISSWYLIAIGPVHWMTKNSYKIPFSPLVIEYINENKGCSRDAARYHVTKNLPFSQNSSMALVEKYCCMWIIRNTIKMIFRYFAVAHIHLRDIFYSDKAKNDSCNLRERRGNVGGRPNVRQIYPSIANDWPWNFRAQSRFFNRCHVIEIAVIVSFDIIHYT